MPFRLPPPQGQNLNCNTTFASRPEGQHHLLSGLRNAVRTISREETWLSQAVNLGFPYRHHSDD
jgi:hypothetical protein